MEIALSGLINSRIWDWSGHVAHHFNFRLVDEIPEFTL